MRRAEVGDQDDIVSLLRVGTQEGRVREKSNSPGKAQVRLGSLAARNVIDTYKDFSLGRKQIGQKGRGHGTRVQVSVKVHRDQAWQGIGSGKIKTEHPNGINR